MPTVPGPPGRLAPWRAAARIARRDASRHRGRSTLVAVLVATPVLLLSTVSVVWRSDDLDPQDLVTLRLGTAGQAAVALDGLGRGAVTQDIQGMVTSQSGDGAGGGSPAAASTTAIRREALGLLPPRDRAVTEVTWYGSGTRVAVGSRVLDAELRELDGGPLPGVYDLTAGRWPAEADQVVVGRRLSQKQQVRIGDRLSVRAGRDARERDVVVVGEVDGADLARSSGALVLGRPGSLLPASSPEQGSRSERWIVTGPDPLTWDTVLDLNRLGAPVLSRAVVADPPPADRVPAPPGSPGGGSDAEVITVLVVGVGLLLLQIGLLAGPAVAVGARRNVHTLALLSATGAERRHLRSVVLATSGIIGLVGCAAAAALGVGLGRLGMAALERWGDTAFVRTDVHIRDLVVLVLIGVGTAVAASVLPARQVARLDVVAALTGRRATALPTHRVPVAGVVVAVVGGLLGWVGAERHMPVPLVLGIAIAEIGLVMASGGVVAAVARLARPLPLAPRLALRDAVRHRGRTAPAVAAVMAAVAGTTAVTLYITAQDRAGRVEYQASGALGTVAVGLGSFESGDGRVSEAAMREQARVATAALDRHMPGTSLVPVRAIDGWDLRFVAPPAQRCPVDGGPGTNVVIPPEWEVEIAADPRCAPPGGELVQPYFGPTVDDGTVAAVLTGVDDPTVRAALRAGRVVVPDPRWLWPDGTVHVAVTPVVDTTDAPDSAPDERTVIIPGAVATSVPRLATAVIPQSALRRLGVQAHQTGLVGRADTMPTLEQERQAEDALEAVPASLMVERGYQSDYGPGLLALLVASLLITLVGTFTAVGLAATEGRPDVATLAAVGAGPGLRRRLAAAQAAVVAGLGAALGVGSGLLAGAALVRLHQPAAGAVAGAAEATWQFTVPWLQVGALGIGVPAVTVLAAFALTRSRLPLQRRIAG